MKSGRHGFTLIERLVYIDEGAMTPDSFATYYDRNQWWDYPMIRHGDGTTISWADGHANHLKWKAVETIEFGRKYQEYHGGSALTPQTDQGIEELRDFRKWVWGKVQG